MQISDGKSVSDNIFDSNINKAAMVENPGPFFPLHYN